MWHVDMYPKKKRSFFTTPFNSEPPKRGLELEPNVRWRIRTPKRRLLLWPIHQSSHQVPVTIERTTGRYGALVDWPYDFKVLGMVNSHIVTLLLFFSFSSSPSFVNISWTFMCPHVFLIKVWCHRNKFGMWEACKNYDHVEYSIASQQCRIHPCHCVARWIIKDWQARP